MCERHSEFTGKVTGKTYTAERAQPRHFAAIKNALIKHYIAEEPMCKYQGCANDAEFIKERSIEWNDALEGGLSLVCTTVIDGKEELAGFILLTKADGNKTITVQKNDKWRKICNINGYVFETAKPFEALCIKEYLTDLGLLVLPDYRGEGVGEHLVKACDAVCKSLNLPATIMCCTTVKSQSLLRKVGYKDLHAVSYAEFRDLDHEKYGINEIDEDTEGVVCLYKKI